MTNLKRWSQGMIGALTSLMWAALAFAQDPAGDVTTTTTTSSEVWYGNWWVWAIGVGVFLIVVIALTNRGGRSQA
jgi:hypothetical protein